MRKNVFATLSKNKLAKISVLPLLVVVAIYGTLLWQNRHGADAATANCYGNAGTHTAVAPTSVNPGQTFKLTSITGMANTNIATVNSTTLSLSISGATPTTASKSWNGGPVHGDYTSHYSDLSLTATGAVGNKITVDITAIDAYVTIGPSNTTITCSVANGQLTANSPGQSLNLATINIVAPASSSSGSSGSTTKSKAAQSTTKSSSSKSTSQSNSKAKTSSDPADDTALSATDDSADTTGQAVTVTVVDSNGKPINGAVVTLDSMPSVKTNSSGQASLANVVTGSHNLSIGANGRIITQAIQVQAPTAGQVLGVNVRMPAPSHKSRDVGVAASLTVVVMAALALWYVKTRRPKVPLPSAVAPQAHDPLLAANKNFKPNMVTPKVLGKSSIDPEPVNMTQQDIKDANADHKYLNN